MGKDLSSYITSIAPEDPEELKPSTPSTTSTAPAESKVKIKIPPKKEIRNARLQVLLTPSLKAKLTARAGKEHRTVNDLVNIILEQTL